MEWIMFTLCGPWTLVVVGAYWWNKGRREADNDSRERYEFMIRELERDHRNKVFYLEQDIKELKEKHASLNRKYRELLAKDIFDAGKDLLEP